MAKQRITPVTIEGKGKAFKNGKAKGFTANQVMVLTGISNREYVFELMRKGTLVVLKRKATIKGQRNLQTVMTVDSVKTYAKARATRLAAKS